MFEPITLLLIAGSIVVIVTAVGALRTHPTKIGQICAQSAYSLVNAARCLTNCDPAQSSSS